jgi:daunorubicin resistance ABC transporter ATP-binding subunit
MICSKCGSEMVRSRTGFLCNACGHAELAPSNVPSAAPGPPKPPAVDLAHAPTLVRKPPVPGRPGTGGFAIEIKNVGKTFGNLKAVDNLTFSVPRGEIFGLLGPNGSGKTTTINMISGLSKPTSGEIRILGFDVTRNARGVHRLLGFVPQETALYEELSAWCNLDFHADLFGVPRDEKKPRITSLLEMVQLQDRKDSLVGTFSGGMKRRLAIARALLHAPELVYLDEPTIGVDVQARNAIWEYILALRSQGKTILITTNYLEEAEALCDRLAIIDHGKLVVLDTPDRLKKQFGGRVLEVYTVDPKNALDSLSPFSKVTRIEQDGKLLKISIQGPDSLVAQIIYVLTHQNEISKVTLREPDLDEIFLRLTGSELRD